MQEKINSLNLKFNRDYKTIEEHIDNLKDYGRCARHSVYREFGLELGEKFQDECNMCQKKKYRR